MLKHRELRSTKRSRGAPAADRIVAEVAAHRAAGRFDKARHKLKLVLDAHPQHADAHFEAGLLARKSGAREPAVQHFVLALRGAPDRPAHWLALASMLVDLDRLGEARALMESFKAQGFSADQVGRVLKAFVEDVYAKGVPATTRTISSGPKSCSTSSSPSRTAMPTRPTMRARSPRVRIVCSTPTTC